MPARLGQVLCWAAIGLLAACVNRVELPQENDLIKDAEAAIRAGKEACSPEDQMFLKESGWHAELHNRKWRVWFCWSRSRLCPNYETEVMAADGSFDECTVQVEAE